MKTIARLRARALLFLLPALLPFLLFGGCFRRAIQEEVPSPVLLWPEPPEIPRIHFVRSVSRAADLGIREGTARRFLRYLAGGTDDAAMGNPHGIAVDAAGRLYVVDSFQRKVHVYDPKERRYSAFPEGREEPMVSPVGIAVDDRRGRIYVSDSAAGVVRVFSQEGWNAAGEIRGGEMGRPTGMAVHEGKDELLVLDTLHCAILRFSLEDHRLKGIVGREGGRRGGSTLRPTSRSPARERSS